MQIDVDIRPWSDGDQPLLERLMGDPAMTEHLGGPETPDKIRDRHQRYLSINPGEGRMFAIVVGPERLPAGSIGYWEKEWRGQKVPGHFMRCNDWRLDLLAGFHPLT